MCNHTGTTCEGVAHQYMHTPLHILPYMRTNTHNHTNTPASKATAWQSCSQLCLGCLLHVTHLWVILAPLVPLHLKLCEIICDRLVPLGCWVDNYCFKLVYRNVIHCRSLHHFRRGNSSPTMHPCPLYLCIYSGHSPSPQLQSWQKEHCHLQHVPTL